MNKKSGITMVILVATVIIAIIILSVSVVSINNTTKNAQMTSFKEELVNIENEISKYYLLTGELPVLDSYEYTKEEISDISSDKTAFMEEISINNESNNSYFVKVDLSKLNFDKSSKGLLKNGENDVYVVSYPDFHVYYLMGMNLDKVNYFSLAKLDKTQSVQNNTNNENEVSLYSGDLYVKKTNKNWSNKLNLEISTFIENGQSIVVSIPQASGGNISNNLTVEVNKTNLIKLDSLVDAGFSNAQIKSFNELSQDKKKVTIFKQKNSDILGQVEVEMSNYDYTIPTYSTEVIKTSYSKYNTIKFSVGDTLSGIDKVKYEYYHKLDEQVDTTYYDDASVYEEKNILQNGKTAEISGGIVTIKIPKNVTSIKYIVIDKAGNTTGLLDLDTKYPIFIKYKTISGTTNSITFDASVESENTVTKFTTAISVDGVNYTQDYNHGKIIDLNSFTYTDIENIYDYIFVKVSVETASVTETRIIQVDTSSFKKEGTTNKAEVSWDNPYIPEGFVHVTGTVRTGFVIQDVSSTDNKYNEFVWVPVDYIYDNTTLYKETNSAKTKLQNLRTAWTWSSSTPTTGSGSQISTSFFEPNTNNLSEVEEYNKMISSVKKYGGFYVARYEAGTIAQRAQNQALTKCVIRKNVYPYNYVKIENSTADQTGGAIELSRNMYSASADVKSHLIYGCQWDAIMHWSNIEGKNIFNGTDWGNYDDSPNSAKSIINTGKNELYKTNNIYDIAGNMWEATMESYSTNIKVFRGGSIGNANNDCPPVFRNYLNEMNINSKTVSFRPVLYITE